MTTLRVTIVSPLARPAREQSPSVISTGARGLVLAEGFTDLTNHQ